MISGGLLTALARSNVVAIVTTRRSGEPLATPIWSVVIDGVAYIRSAYGPSSWWYRHALSGRPVSFVVGDGAVAERDRDAALALPREPVRLIPVAADDPIQQDIDAEIRRKYAGAAQSSVDETLTPAAVACTLRVDAPGQGSSARA